MTTMKVAVTISADVVRLARREVAKGRARSFSAFVNEAVDEKLERDALVAVLDEMDREHGKPGKDAVKWARRVLAR